MTQTAAPAWLARFFAQPNTIDWADYASGALDDSWRAVIAPWVEPLQSDPDAPVLLPFRHADGAVTWYAAGPVRRRLQALIEDLSGFLGQTYGGFTGCPQDLEANETGGQMLADNHGGLVYRAGPYLGDRVESVRRALARYGRVISRRPGPRGNAVRSIGALRSRFERALAAGNEPEATRLHKEILDSGRLSRENRLFLGVRLAAGLGKWGELASDETLLRQARALALPPQVRAELVEALYRTHVSQTERADAPGAAIRMFSEPALVQNARLFLSRQGATRSIVVKAFLLHALHKNASYDELRELASYLDEGGPDGAFIAALNALIASRAPVAPPPPTPDPVADADAAFDDGEVDRAFALYLATPRTRKNVTRIIQCAGAINTAEAAQIADRSAREWTDPAQPLSANILSILERLRSQLPQTAETVAPEQATPPNSWSTWVHWATSCANANAVLSLARNEASNWSTDAYRDPVAARQLADAIGTAAYEYPACVQPALPLIFEAFAATPDSPVAEWKPIYSALLTALTLSGSRTPDELELARILTAHLTAIGLDSREYEHLISDLKEVLVAEASLNTLDWALDLAEVLLINRSALPDKRLGLIVEILEIARTRAHRLSGAHKHALKLLCSDLSMDPPAFVTAADDTPDDQKPASALADRSIAIYTLAESAGQRAARMLAEIEPSARVSLNNDLVCTERLAGLAKTADLFVFAWRSSKHAAYYCVKNHRPPDLPILMPLGKGSASILQVLLRS